MAPRLPVCVLALVVLPLAAGCSGGCGRTPSVGLELAPVDPTGAWALTARPNLQVTLQWEDGTEGVRQVAPERLEVPTTYALGERLDIGCAEDGVTLGCPSIFVAAGTQQVGPFTLGEDRAGSVVLQERAPSPLGAACRVDERLLLETRWSGEGAEVALVRELVFVSEPSHPSSGGLPVVAESPFAPWDGRSWPGLAAVPGAPAPPVGTAPHRSCTDVLEDWAAALETGRALPPFWRGLYEGSTLDPNKLPQLRAVRVSELYDARRLTEEEAP